MPSRSTDAERPLTAQGKKEVEDVADSLSKLKVRPDHVISSPLKRARETASIVSKNLKKKVPVETWNELKPEGERQDLYKRLSLLKSESQVLLVGHEPYLSLMINDLVNQSGKAKIVLKKAGLARVHVVSFAPRADGELRWLLSPKLLKKIS